MTVQERGIACAIPDPLGGIRSGPPQTTASVGVRRQTEAGQPLL